MLSQLQEQAPNLKESALRQYADDFEMLVHFDPRPCRID